MNEQGGRIPWWLCLQLWGVDVFLATVCWGLGVAALMQVTIIEEGPLVLLGVAGWICSLAVRLWGAVRGKGWFVSYYRSHAAPMLMLTFGVGMAAVWLSFFYVGQSILDYAFFPVLLLLLAVVVGTFRRMSDIGGLAGLLYDFLLGLSYAQACIVPACYFSFVSAPLNRASLWYFAVLMGLYFMMRRSWLLPKAERERRDLIITCGLLMMMIMALLTSLASPFFERSLCVMIAMACACLQVLMQLRERLSNEALFSLSWWVMALPPVICISVFAPETWWTLP